MPYCSSCGANNPDGNTYCTSCGAPLSASAPAPAPVVNAVPQYVAPISTGGMLAWSIIVLLFCTIPGIVAIVKTSGINKSYTVEEQQQKLKSAKIWCIVGSVLGALALIVMMMNR